MACQFFGWVIQGTLSLEYGPGGRRTERVPAGRFFRIPPHLVHRDVNATPETVLVATWCIGEGTAWALVDGPGT